MIVLKHIDGGEITPKDDALFYDYLVNQSGVFEGCAVSHLGANQLKIATGRGIVKGRYFSISEEIILAILSTSGSKKGRLLIRIDLSNTTNPIQFATQCEDTLPQLVQEDLNRGGNIFELPLAIYDVDATMITNLVIVFPTIVAVTVSNSERDNWNEKVPQTRKINNKPLSGDISLTAADVGALQSSGTAVNSLKLNGKAESALAVASAVNAATATKWNGKAIWIGTESSKGTDANTIYFCY